MILGGDCLIEYVSGQFAQICSWKLVDIDTFNVTVRRWIVFYGEA